ncbi:hypothetical protein BGW36DRAFT_367407 [Talaromyces proteolyticus]|uniref:Uncharacterized protein n=1 Tax=Talaromyces proteolyticus TaxID=1131652 RepID=A0AAD4L684_9EURO|nr:uncharacterized protein BGW36DRAFT_367407 [Talaromyces proteolyticus]KAH8705350.1 hypothetical protein BGW36DRAFT_367407 [Talaromyces proteolyticus]
MMAITPVLLCCIAYRLIYIFGYIYIYVMSAPIDARSKMLARPRSRARHSIYTHIYIFDIYILYMLTDLTCPSIENSVGFNSPPQTAGSAAREGCIHNT